MAKRKKSSEIKSTDGRKGNKRLPPKVQIGSNVTSKPARMNQAKKNQVSKFAINAIKKTYGSELGAMEKLAEMSADSFQHMKLLLEYAYGKAGEMSSDGVSRKSNAPVINFINNAPKENIIEIDSEDIEEDE